MTNPLPCNQTKGITSKYSGLQPSAVSSATRLLTIACQKNTEVPQSSYLFLTSESEATHCHRNRIAVRTMARSNEPKFTHSSCLSVSTVCNNAISKASPSVCSLGVTKCSASRRSGDCLDSHNQECRMLKMLDSRAWAGRPTITKQAFKIRKHEELNKNACSMMVRHEVCCWEVHPIGKQKGFHGPQVHLL